MAEQEGKRMTCCLLESACSLVQLESADKEKNVLATMIPAAYEKVDERKGERGRDGRTQREREGGTQRDREGDRGHG